MGGGEVCGGREEKTSTGNDCEALSENAPQFIIAAGTVIVAYDGRGSHGIADVNRFKKECHIHDHAEGGDPVRSGDGDQLVIVEHGNEGHGNICQKLGGAVRADLPKRRTVPFRFHQLERRCISFKEVNQREKTACVFAKHCGEAGA